LTNNTTCGIIIIETRKPSKNKEEEKMRKISTLYAYGKTFIIFKDSYGYWGIESKYVDKNGCLVENVNGLRGHLNKQFCDTIR
jgi:hypothetical protein